MACPFNVQALSGRGFADVLDEITTWSGSLGFTEKGPGKVGISITQISEEERQREAAAIREREEIRRKLAPLISALRERAVELLTINGAAVPLWVWFSGRWTFYRDEERQVEKLVALTEAGQKVEYYTQHFALPAAPGRRSPKRSAGRKAFDDGAEIAAARQLVAAGKNDHAAAGEVAWARFPDKKDDVQRGRLARRVYDKLREAVDEK